MILLHTTKYGENNLILHSYTAESGRTNYILRGCNKKSNQPKGCLHPLSIITPTEVLNSKGKQLKPIKEFSPTYDLDSIRSDIYKTTMAIFIGEVLYRTLCEETPDRELYSFLEKSIILLNSLENNYANFHIWFLIAYITKLGFMPNFEENSEDMAFSEEESIIIKNFLNENFEKLMFLPLSREKRSNLANSLVEYLKISLGYNNMEIKSLSVLHQVFS